MPNLRSHAKALILAVPLVACKSTAPHAATTASAFAPEPTDCVLQAVTWQKDAYLANPGRNFGTAYPPHTTIELRLSCSDGTDESLCEADNHGTALASRAPDGRQTLASMGTTACQSGSREELRARADELCHLACDDQPAGTASTFLNDKVAKERFTEFLQASLQKYADCAPIAAFSAALDGKADPVSFERWAALAKDVGTACPGVASKLAQDFSGAFASGNALRGFHVCNNDAHLILKFCSSPTRPSAFTDAERDAIRTMCATPDLYPKWEGPGGR
jgi:hypothetical protein